MHISFSRLALIAAGVSSLFARVVVFEQPGFPTVDSQPVSHATFANALGGEFAGTEALKNPATLTCWCCRTVPLFPPRRGAAFTRM